MKFLFTVLFIFLSLFGYSQIINGEYILEIEENSYNQVLREIPSNDRSISVKEISKDLSLVFISGMNEEAIKRWKATSPHILNYYQNHSVSLRAIPDDPDYNRQWNLRTINADRLWEQTTGGTTIEGDEIVVAVLDDGFDINHEDLRDNIWANPGETPGDGIDNDGNGYTDDYHGLNVLLSNDNHPIKNHGTGTAGIVGAKGNNKIGISGVNWDVKILPISNVLSTAAVIEAYQYVYELRKRYNETDGAEGAYIVATNYSAGISRVFGSDAPYNHWCDMYDLLGSVGIVSCGATANDNVNVDVVGDMPSTCPSPYFICVTNSTREDEFHTNAGYGPIHVDISAPGKGGYTLEKNDGYGSFGGTSGATPHVAGSIALLHGLDCPDLIAQSKDNPELFALKIKRAIMDSAFPLPSLKGKITTGGRLDVLAAAYELGSECPEIGLPSDRGALNILDINRISYDVYNIKYISADERDNYRYIVSDASGKILSSGQFQPQSTGQKQLYISGLQLPPNIYFFTIYNFGGISTKRYLVLE